MLNFADNSENACYQQLREQELQAIYEDARQLHMESFRITLEEEINYLISKQLDLMKDCNMGAIRSTYTDMRRDVSSVFDEVLNGYFG